MQRFPGKILLFPVLVLMLLISGRIMAEPVKKAATSGYISVVVFNDLNANGGRFSNEPLMKGVQVDVLVEKDGKQTVVASGRTNKEGALILRELPLGVCRVAVTLPEPYIVGPLGQKFNPFYNCIPPTNSNYGVSEPFDLQTSQGIGIGCVKSGSLKSSLWLDSNLNGKMDADEQGAPGIEISMIPLNGIGSKTITTTADKHFEFKLLQEGEYKLKVKLPDNLMFALPKGDSLFSDSYSSEDSATVKLTTLKPIEAQAIGVMPATSLIFQAYQDENANGVQDAGEAPFEGALIEVLENGKTMSSAMSDKDGKAIIPRAKSGDLEIRCTLPKTHVFSQNQKGSNVFETPSAVNIALTHVKLEACQANKASFGVSLPASIEGCLFDDADLSGVFNQGEGLLEGFEVEAINPKGESVSKALTDKQGNYSLGGLVPGEYRVRFYLQSPYIFSKLATNSSGMTNHVESQTPKYGETAFVKVGPGESLKSIDGGAFRSAVVEGQILLGDENDGFSGKQGGLKGVEISLLDTEGKPVSQYTIATSDEQGAFSLKGALPGSYTLKYQLPKDAKFSKPLLDLDSFQSPEFTLKSSDLHPMETLFAVKTGTLSGVVYEDGDFDGKMGSPEKGLPEVQITATDKRSGEKYEAFSDADGRFLISGLRPGSYSLELQLPEDMLIYACDNPLFPAADQSTSRIDFAVEMGINHKDQLISAVKPASINGNVYLDEDLDKLYTAGKDTPAPQRSITLKHVLTQKEYKLTSDENGAIALPVLFPGDYVLSAALPENTLLFAPEGGKEQSGTWTCAVSLNSGNEVLNPGLVSLGSWDGQVWNLDGSLDHVSGLSIRLLKTNGEVAAETTTDSEGRYHLTRLYPGEYQLSAVLPADAHFARSLDTQKRASILVIDSASIQGNQGTSPSIALQMGESKQNQDIGMGFLGRLGDIAWWDRDEDGLQDAGEPGVPGIQIKLFQFGQLTNETRTDAYGRYLFKDLYPGDYQVEVTMPVELKATKQRSDFPLVSSILPERNETTLIAENVHVPGLGRNLNCDFGFTLRKEGQLPKCLEKLPVKDWTPITPYTPERR